MPLPGSFTPPPGEGIVAPPTIFSYPPSLPGLATTPPTITTPAFPATGSAITNTTGVDVVVYVTGGTLSSLVVNGGTVATGTGADFAYVPAGYTIQYGYTGAPTWVWQAV
jgi:hypothetical protein